MPVTIKKTTLYSVPEMAVKLAITEVTIRNYLKRGKFKGQKIMGRWFIAEDNLTDFFKELVAV